MTLISAQKLRDSLLGKSLVGEAGVRFHLRTLLGEGGQGWVFKANYDDPEGFWIVVKMLRHVEGDAVDALRRFEREAKVLQMLGSVPTPNPNIVRFYDHGVLRVPTPVGEITLPFMALEFVDGPTLAALVDQQRGHGLPLGHALSLMKQVARALGTVHEHRIVHRDLKPSNILLATVQGQQIAKVTDFGLVKVTDLSARSTATVAGATLGYAPPEQYEMGNNRVSAQTDIFSYATILFEVLSGQVAFPHKQGDSPLRTVARMLTGERPGLARVASTLPPELRARPDLVRVLDAEIARATHADPRERHESVFDLWTRVEPALREALRAEQPSGPYPETRASFPSNADTLGASSMPGYAAIGAPLVGDTLRSATFSPEDGVVYGLGVKALHAFARGLWTTLSLPALPPAELVKGLARLATGELLVLGEAGLAMAFSSTSGGRRLLAPDPEITWYGAHTDDGDVVLVGERRAGGRSVGLLGEVGPRGIAVRNIEGTTRLVAVTRIASGTFVACGSHGALVHVLPAAMLSGFAGHPGHEDIAWGRTGHLTAICRSFEGGAFAVGTGGHALSIRAPEVLGSAPLATLESVQTTRDLLAVDLDARGTAWAAGGQARLLVRDDGRWIRVPMDLTGSTLVALSMRQRSGAPSRPVFVAEDGTVIEGGSARG